MMLTVNVAQVRKQIDRRLWTIDVLAQKAACSTRTINSVLAGKPVARSTITKLAKAFGIDANELLVEGESRSEEGNPLDCITLTLKIEISFKDFDETVDCLPIIERLRRVLNIKRDLEPESMEDNSVLIAISLTRKEATDLLFRYYKPGVPFLPIVTDILIPHNESKLLGVAIQRLVADTDAASGMLKAYGAKLSRLKRLRAVCVVFALLWAFLTGYMAAYPTVSVSLARSEYIFTVILGVVFLCTFLLGAKVVRMAGDTYELISRSYLTIAENNRAIFKLAKKIQ